MDTTLPRAGTPAATPFTRTLLADGSLTLHADPEVMTAVEPWVPRIPPEPTGAPGAAVIRVEHGGAAVVLPDTPPELRMGSLRGHILRQTQSVVLAGPGERVTAKVDLAAMRATVRVSRSGRLAEELAAEAFEVLTVSGALLLTRLRRALLHAAAVVAPDGRAWLLVGGTFSGKTTTCLNLIRGGWDWLSDDLVVLGAADDGGIRVEGWPRRFSLDHGYLAGTSTGTRSRVDPEGFGPGRWRRSAPLAGLLFPRVEADQPTTLAPLHPAGALGCLLDQTPWLLADSGAARPVLALLERAVRQPARELRLGADTYCDIQRLQLLLEPVILS
jgi:hypothetical protein